MVKKLRIKNKKTFAVAIAVLTLLVLLGVVNDPTTAGFKDSEKALAYDKPKEENK